MTTTRAGLRAMVRRRLADVSAEPLWDDALLDDAIAEAVRRYGDRMPREDMRSVAVVAGARTVAMPAGVSPFRIVRVFDDRGDLWSAWQDADDAPPPIVTGPARGNRAWRLWGGDLILAASAPRSGTWRLEFLADRAVPTDDVTPLDAEIGDEDMLISLAMHVALVRRVIADGKSQRSAGRGAHPLMEVARMAQVDAEHLFWLRRRRVKASTLGLREARA